MAEVEKISVKRFSTVAVVYSSVSFPEHCWSCTFYFSLDIDNISRLFMGGVIIGKFVLLTRQHSEEPAGVLLI